MLYPGEYQRLTISRLTPQGFYLIDAEENEVLLPGQYRTPDMKVEDVLEVFIYLDSEHRPIATTDKPRLTLNTAAPLTVTDVNAVGAFCDWGVSKELFIPFRNQQHPMRVDQKAVVYLYLDEQSQRLVGTTIFKKHFKELIDEGLEMGQEVNLLVADKTDLGYKVIINQTYLGLLYDNEVEQPLPIGFRCKGFIKPLRPDGKIDVGLHAIGVASIEPNAQVILDQLKKKDGFLPFTDKSDPADIRIAFGISKKLFKKAIGGLYRQKVVLLKDDGIHLIGK